MGVTVELRITKGSSISKSYLFDSVATVYIGRSSECNISVTEKTVSRFHCLFDIVPPAVKVRDFGSLNGTYVNNTLIGKRNKEQSIEEARENPGLLIDVKNNDTVQLGKNCELKILVRSDLVCAVCGKKVGLIPGDFVSTDGIIRCCQCNTKNKNIKQVIVQERPKILQPNIYQLQENQALFPGYKAIRLLGRGGMGEVWLAEKVNNGGIFAIKRMLPKSVILPGAQKAFLREASISNQLKHKNIVTQYNYYNRENETFIVMEYCNGGSVDNLIRLNRKLFTVDEALECIIQVLEGLDYAHNADVVAELMKGVKTVTKGVVHRDFKPSNIFICNHNNSKIYKVADFGLAKSFEMAGLSDFTRAGQIAGTPSFMPRQQVIDFRYAKPEVDVWAAAASLYYILTGFTPKQKNGMDPWLCAVVENAIPIRKRNSKIPEKLAEIIDEALIDCPSIPFKSAKAFQAELKRI